MEIKNKVAVVTGGTKGIGFATSAYLLDRGAKVFICGRDEAGLQPALARLREHGNAEGTICDVRNERDVERILNEAETAFRPLDILINNAGVGKFGQTVEEMSPADFRLIVETNLFGVFYACHHAIPLMKKHGGGYIINISSLAGQNAHPRMAAYNASKFALNGFSESLMQEVRHDNIKVSYICPGSVNTEFGGDEVSTEKMWQIQPDDIAQVIAELISMDQRALTSKVEIRPSQPPVK